VQYRIRDDDVEWRRIGGEVVILDLRSSRYFTVNETGARLWPLLAAGADADRLTDELAAAFALDRTVAARDVEAFLGELSERGLVAAVAPADG
jgi:hypothetical protein